MEKYEIWRSKKSFYQIDRNYNNWSTALNEKGKFIAALQPKSEYLAIRPEWTYENSDILIAHSVLWRWQLKYPMIFRYTQFLSKQNASFRWSCPSQELSNIYELSHFIIG